MPSYYSILPVLFLEFLAISLTRAILPPLLTTTFPDSIYLLMGLAEAAKGLLAFMSTSTGEQERRWEQERIVWGGELYINGDMFSCLVVTKYIEDGKPPQMYHVACIM